VDAQCIGDINMRHLLDFERAGFDVVSLLYVKVRLNIHWDGHAHSDRVSQSKLT
jgi:hypothetical protein